jgi:hypothetical protein
MDFTVGFWTGITLSLVIFEVSFRWSLGKDWRQKLRHLAVLSDGAIGLDHDVVRTSETLPLVTIRHTVAATITIWFSALLSSFSFIGPFLQPSLFADVYWRRAKRNPSFTTNSLVLFNGSYAPSGS